MAPGPTGNTTAQFPAPPAGEGRGVSDGSGGMPQSSAAGPGKQGRRQGGCNTSGSGERR
jgi:hypothetical protein